MDNRSIAAFIETNRTRTNSVIICLPSKGAGREKRTNIKCTTEKWMDQGKEVGAKRRFSLRAIKTNGEHMAFKFM